MANETNENPRLVGWTNFLSFSWCIGDFTNKMKMEIGERLDSELFVIKTNSGYTSWYLMMFPNGQIEDRKGNVGIHLIRSGVYEFPVEAEVTLSIVDNGGKKGHVRKCKKTFEKNLRDVGWGFPKFVPHSLLVKFQDTSLNLLPDNSLTILCEISMDGRIREGALERRDVTAKTESMVRLSSDYLSICLEDKFADFEIVCDGMKLPCHKNVLASRSPVFGAMFSHDFEENRRSSLNILDLDYDTVRDMMGYIYSGHVAGLKDKAIGLLAAAEKYDLKDLKQMCEISLSQNIDKDNALDMIVLADLHSAGMVRNIALKFIVCNGEEIVTQPNWRDKLKGHPEIMADMFEVSMKNKSV